MSEDKDTKDIEKMVEKQAKESDAEGAEEEKALDEEGTLDDRKSKGGLSGLVFSA